MSKTQPTRTRNRPTRSQREQIDAVVDELLAGRTPKHTIKEVLLAAYGLKWRASERAIMRAKKRLLVETGKSEDEHRSEALAAYVAIFRSRESSQREKLLANDGICKLLGLNKPQRISVSDERAADESMAALTATRQKLVADPETNELLCQLSERMSSIPVNGISEVPESAPVDSAVDKSRGEFKKNGKSGSLT